MDIHENEDQLGEVEPMPADEESLEENNGDELTNLEVGEAVQLSTEPEEMTESEVDEDSEVEDEEEASSEAVVEEIPPEEPPAQEESASQVKVEDEGLPEPVEVDYPEDSLQEEIPLDPYAAVTLSEQPVKEPEDGRAWYVVHCYSGNEDKVRHNILQRIESMSMDELIFDVVVPTEDEVNIKNGERQTVEKKVFPGYILVNMILTEESWYMVRNTPGVTGFVGMGNDPTPLQPEEVARILKRMESESPRINVTFRPGERVRIVDGPFEDFYGKVDEIDMERATVRVMVNFFGRETPVELDFLQVEEA
jgi:transcriptional antiterminator NusG